LAFELKLVSIDGDECMAKALAEVERGLQHVNDPDVWRRDGGPDGPTGLLWELRRYAAAYPPSYEAATAIEIAFELGKAATSGKVDPTARQRLGGRLRGAERRNEADRVWRDDAKRIWRDTRGSRTKGDPLRKSQSIVADIICAEVPNAPDHDRVVKTLRAWDRGAS
jgi:hypothetical protein